MLLQRAFPGFFIIKELFEGKSIVGLFGKKLTEKSTMIAILDYICLGFKANIRKDAGVVERGGLEIRYTALLYPGFESLSFRKIQL